MRVEADTLVKSDLQVSSLVDQYNTLIDQRRFDESCRSSPTRGRTASWLRDRSGYDCQVQDASEQ